MNQSSSIIDDEDQNFDHHIDSYTFSDLLSFWINGVLSLILVCIGTLGNLAVVLSLHCRKNKNSPKRRQAFYFYLMTFAFWNTGLLMATVLFNCIPVLLKWYPKFRAMTDLCTIFGYLLGNCCLTANVWLAVLVTIERYLAVSLPFHSTRLTSPRRRAKMVSVILSLGAILYNLPLLFELTLNPRMVIESDHDQVVPLEPSILNTTMATFEETQFYFDDFIALENLALDGFISIDQQSDQSNLDQSIGVHLKLDQEPDQKYETIENHALVRNKRESISPDHLDQHGHTGTGIVMSSMRDNIYYQFVYRVVGNMLFVSGLPFLIVLLLTIKIVCLVRESDRRRATFRRRVCQTKSNSTAIVDRSSTNLERSIATNAIANNRSVSPNVNNGTAPASTSSWRHAHVVLTLIAAKFLLCYSLPVAINILEMTIDRQKYDNAESAHSRALAILVDLSNLLIVLDGATNAFFYFSWWRSRLRLRNRFSRSRKTTENNSFAGLGLNEMQVSQNDQQGASIQLLRKSPHSIGSNSHKRLSTCSSSPSQLATKKVSLSPSGWEKIVLIRDKSGSSLNSSASVL